MGGQKEVMGLSKTIKQKKLAGTAKIWGGAVFAAFAASVAVYAALLQTEKNVLTDYEKKEVYLAAAEIPAGQVIYPEDAEKYYCRALMDAALVPETAIKDPARLAGMIAAADIEKGVVLTGGMFRETSEILRDMEHPVVAGFRAEDLFQVVGGVLRAGDKIHIYSSEENGETSLIWENVYVQQVFDSGGSMIENNDRTAAAQRINIFLDKDDVEQFYSRLEQGSLRVVRDWRQSKP